MNNATVERDRTMVTLPKPLRAWINEQAAKHCTSANAEIIRSVRERRERDQTEQQARGA